MFVDVMINCHGTRLTFLAIMLSLLGDRLNCLSAKMWFLDVGMQTLKLGQHDDVKIVLTPTNSNCVLSLRKGKRKPKRSLR